MPDPAPATSAGDDLGGGSSGGHSTDQGDGVRRLVQVMDRLRSPGGCPWDAEQTHQSLAPYAVEEAHELAEAIALGDRAHLREELGDLLLQVVFHARVAQEDPDDPFDLDDVADAIVAKLERRHPHVFGDAQVSGAADVAAGWEDIKAIEKPERLRVLDGVPATLPSLAGAAKLYGRLRRRDQLALWSADPLDPRAADLLAAVAACVDAGVDPEQLLRTTVLQVADRADRAVR